MKKKPIIGIAGNERPFPEDPELNMSYVPSGFVEGVEAVGGLPVVIPLADKDLIPAYVELIDKLILTGGQNVAPKFYGEEQTIESDDYSLKRDEFELALIQEVRKAGKPIFAVCRGMQLFNVAMGGSLHQDIPGHWQEESGQCTTQGLVIEHNSVLADLYDDDARINSFHRQSIKDLAQNLTVIARSPEDDIIEAVVTTDGPPFLGVQWHPELLQHVSSAERQLIRYVVHDL